MFTSPKPSHLPAGESIKIVLASQSAIKVTALKAALQSLGLPHLLVTAKAKSSVAEQPVGDETILGATNRIVDAMALCPDADMIVAIENGIFEEGDKKIDKAVVMVRYKVANEYVDHIAYSEGVEFPAACFNQAKALGFDKTVVAEVMVNQGLVESRDDPHASLGKRIPRAKLLADTLARIDLGELCRKITERTVGYGGKLG